MDTADPQAEEVLRRVHRRRVWLWWIAANALGAGLGGLLAGAAGTALTPSFDVLHPDSAAIAGLMLSSVAIIPMSGALTGSGLALAQWLVLWQAFRGADWRAGLCWVALGALAGAVAAQAALILFVLMLFPAAFLFGGGEGEGFANPASFFVMGVAFLLLAGAVGGLLVGAAQWLVLRRYSRRAGAWIPANVIGWAAGLLLVMAVFLGSWLAAVGIVSTPIAGIAAGGAAVITGRTLVRLLEDWRPERRIGSRARWSLLLVLGALGIAGACAGLIALNDGLPVTGQPGRAVALAWAPDGRQVAVANDTGQLEFREAVSGTVTVRYPIPVGTPIALHWQASGQIVQVAVQQENRALTVLAVPGGTVRATLPLTDWVSSLAWSRDGQRLAFAQSIGTLQAGSRVAVWAPASGSVTTTRGLVTTTQWLYTLADAAAWSPDGRRLALGGSYQPPLANMRDAVFLWDPDGGLSTSQSDMLLGTTGQDVEALAWSPDGQMLATAGSDGTARVWDVNRRLVTTVFHHNQEVQAVAWSPDGRDIASASADGTAQVWDAQTGRWIATFNHPSPVRVVAWSPDGRRLTTIAVDGLVRFWNVK